VNLERLNMNQYERANAAHKIDGYLLRVDMPGRTIEQEFAKAQAECLVHLQAQLDHVRSLNLDQFTSVMKLKSDLATSLTEAQAEQAFIADIARLSRWDWSDDKGNELNECEQPSEGYEDSHNVLMHLIEGARALRR
jgi:hypothetical protein